MTVKEIIGDVLKSRTTATVLGVAANYLAVKSDLPPDELLAVMTSITALIAVYVVQRGISKSKEIAAKNGSSKSSP